MRFFIPQESFWKFAEQFTGLRILDVGSGDGELVRELRARGFEAYGVDPRYQYFDLELPPDLAGIVVPCEVAQVPGLVGACDVVLCCRPCHSGFPGDIAPMLGRTGTFYYVGFEDNLLRDLGHYAARAVRVLEEPVGEDEEYIYQIHTS